MISWLLYVKNRKQHGQSAAILVSKYISIITQQRRIVMPTKECLVFRSSCLDFTSVSSLGGPSASLQLTTSTQPNGYLGGCGETCNACKSESHCSGQSLRRIKTLGACQGDAVPYQLLACWPQEEGVQLEAQLLKTHWLLWV